jgi:hypothetical protein
MKQYTVTVHLRRCAEEAPFLTFSGYEAYQQWISGRDIHGFAKLNGVDVAHEMIVPRHAITKIELATTEAESTPVVDAFCGETSPGENG